MCLVAVQHAFPEAVVRAHLDRVGPDRSFAAWQLDVSHADKAATDLIYEVGDLLGSKVKE